MERPEKFARETRGYFVADLPKKFEVDGRRRFMVCRGEQAKFRIMVKPGVPDEGAEAKAFSKSRWVPVTLQSTDKPHLLLVSKRLKRIVGTAYRGAKGKSVEADYKKYGASWLLHWASHTFQSKRAKLPQFAKRAPKSLVEHKTPIKPELKNKGTQSVAQLSPAPVGLGLSASPSLPVLGARGHAAKKLQLALSQPQLRPSISDIVEKVEELKGSILPTLSRECPGKLVHPDSKSPALLFHLSVQEGKKIRPLRLEGLTATPSLPPLTTEHVLIDAGLVDYGSFKQVRKVIEYDTGETLADAEIPIRDGSLTDRRTVDREIQILRMLQGKDCVVQLKYVLVGGPVIRLIFEYCKRGNLRDYMANPAVGLEERLRLACDIAQGLDIVHSMGIVHRDIKPGNVLVGETLNLEGQTIPCAKLADFGLSRFADDEKAFKKCRGTREYRSPELGALKGARDPKPIDGFAADIWALGVTFTKLFKPYEKEQASHLRHLYSLISDMKQLDLKKRPPAKAIYKFLVETIAAETARA